MTRVLVGACVGLLEAGEVRKLTVGKQKPNTAGRRTFLWDMTQKAEKNSKKCLHWARAAVYIFSRAKAQLTSRSGGIGRRASLRC